MSRFRRAWVCGSLAACLAIGKAEDWPEFLGPRRNGTSMETGLLAAWPEQGPPVAWELPIGAGYSAPSIRGGHLVVHHRAGEEEVVESLDPATGKSRWRHAYPSRFVDPYGYNNGPRCTPLLTETRCYTFGAEGMLLCLNLEDGKKVWSRDTGKEWTVPEAFFGVGSSPVLHENKLFVMVGGQPNSGMVAFDAETGKTLWESVGQSTWEGRPKLGWPGEPPVVWSPHEKQASYATPVLATVHGRTRLFCLMRQGLVVLDPVNGQVQFSRWFRSIQEESVNAANPVVVEDQVLISAAYYRVGSVLLRIDPDGRRFEEVWKSPVLEIHWTTPIVKDGYVYAFSGRNEPDSRFRCVELKTGKLMWERNEAWRRTTLTPPTYGRGSAILAENRLLVLGEGGLLGLFEANPEAPVERGRFQVPGLHYPCWTAPVLSNKRLYLRSENRLVCLDLSPR